MQSRENKVQFAFIEVTWWYTKRVNTMRRGSRTLKTVLVKGQRWRRMTSQRNQQLYEVVNYARRYRNLIKTSDVFSQQRASACWRVRGPCASSCMKTRISQSAKLCAFLCKALHMDLSHVYTRKLQWIYKPARCLRYGHSRPFERNFCIVQLGPYTAPVTLHELAAEAQFQAVLFLLVESIES